MTQPKDADHLEAKPTEETGYERAQRRNTLYRVLAENMIRQLRDAGYHGHELLGFASAVMQAITDNGWDPRPENASDPAEPPESPVPNEIGPDGGSILRGARVLLRPPQPADQSALARWDRDPLIKASLIPPVLRHVMRHLPELANDPNRVDFIVCDRTGETPIGLVSLHDVDHTLRQAELGKMIGEPDYRGRGAAQEATRLIVGYGFETMDLNRIYLRTRGGNLKNIRLNERMGFRFEGVLQQAALSEGRLTDVVLMGMLRREFHAQRGRD